MEHSLPDKPVVFMKFLDKPILREDGRLVYALANAFSLGGYEVELFDNINYMEIGPLGPLISSIPGVRIKGAAPASTDEVYYIYDREDPSLSRKNWKKKIHVKFDVFSNYAWDSYRGREPIMVPYPMHPWNYGNDLKARLNVARATEKKVRVFFSGDTKDYKRNRILYPKPKLTRTQVIDTIIQNVGDDLILVSENAMLDDVLHGSYKKKCAIVDMSKVYVGDWLTNLAKAEFFVCPPGYVMPMCHNAVEAMAVGTIPIINYPEWFRPSLRHMETCLAFDDESDLLRAIDLALQLSADEIARMRRNVIELYDRYLDPVAFVGEIRSREQKRVTVLMITDLCVVESAPKLNRNSILIRDRPLGPDASVRALLSTLRSDRRAP